ncbi:MAG: cysteine desulfurase [Ignavibacteriales bacterium]|nr:cysteine desulfurase [Ignavibacteriales bacterium]
MKVYFDNAATTPLHPKVFEKMKKFLSDEFGNPSSIHSFGRTTRVAIEEARETVAQFINADESEIYFTSGGTEANNFCLSGIAKTELLESKKNQIIISKAEHHSILETAEELEKNNFVVIYNDVLPETIFNYRTFEKNLSEQTSLVSIIHINNETGSQNDIKQIADISKKNGSFIHTDTVQSFGKININVKELGVDSLSASAHKINGPKGIGLAFVKSGTPISPLIFGGSQERNRRGGTENVAAIVGFAEAIHIAQNEINYNYDRVKKIRDEFVKGLSSIDSKGIRLNGGADPLPYILSITFNSEFYRNDPEAMLMYMDINGVAVSNGAACTSGTLKPSHVILSAGYSVEDANGTIRFSFGSQNTLEEVEYTLEVLKKMAEKFRR